MSFENGWILLGGLPLFWNEEDQDHNLVFYALNAEPTMQKRLVVI